MQSTEWQWPPHHHEDAASTPSLRRRFGRSSRSHHCILLPDMHYLYWKRGSSIHNYRPDRKGKRGLSFNLLSLDWRQDLQRNTDKNVFCLIINHLIITSLRMLNVAQWNVSQIAPLHRTFCMLALNIGVDSFTWLSTWNCTMSSMLETDHTLTLPSSLQVAKCFSSGLNTTAFTWIAQKISTKRELKLHFNSSLDFGYIQLMMYANEHKWYRNGYKMIYCFVFC